MSLNVIKKQIVAPDGTVVTIETGKLAKQAHGSVELRVGNTVLLATVVSSYDAKDGIDFMPLSVDYQEKFSAAGKIPGGFLKREGRSSDYEVLVSRLIDRAIRPLFPSEYYYETQVLVTLISSDKQHMPDAYAALAASAALTASDIPFAGPISEVRVGRINGEYIINPTQDKIADLDIDLIVAATSENILMVEGEMNEVSELEMMEAMKVAHDEIKKHCAVQKEFEAEFGKTTKREVVAPAEDAELEKKIFDAYYSRAVDVVKQHITVKAERSAALGQFKEEYVAALPEGHTEDLGLVSKYFNKLKKKAVRNHVLDDRIRLDGRQLDEIRPIWSEVDYLPTPHGSSVFTRGETQALCTVTLGTKMDEKMVDGAVFSGTDKFMLHYNFPAFSVGEARPNRGPGRREVGHGNLALRALKKVLPEDMPYTIRVISDVLESNGSSSMATVCGGALALMDAGVAIKAPVSGIAMGLISDEETGKYAILSDISGDEDHLGDMDFKVTGTEKGITACQMDIKVDGLSYEVLGDALEQARKGRTHIMGEMKKTLAAPRAELKENAPRIEIIIIDKEFIGAVIGPGGKIIQEIQATTGATIAIEEVDGKGRVQIFADNKESLDGAVLRIKGIVAVPEVGEVYDAKVKAIQPYGAFVEILPGKEGLLHISEIKWERVETMEGVLEVGEEIKVKLIGVDPKSGKLKLSRKALLPKPETAEN